MASINEFQDAARRMGGIIAEAASERGRIAVESQEADRRSKRMAAAERWADDPSVDIIALDFEGDPNPDGPIIGEAFASKAEAAVAGARSKARACIRRELDAAGKLASSAPQDLVSLVTVMQLRKRADHQEAVELYDKCASESWPLARAVADAARGFGLLVWDAQGTIDNEVPKALAREAEELLDMVAGTGSKRPTSPAYGARSAEHGEGSFAALSLLDAIDDAAIGFEDMHADLADHRSLTAVYDTATGKVTAVREKGGDLDRSAVRRIEKQHAEACGGRSTDYAKVDAAIARAFRVR